jgi:hypothetical protein
VNGQTTATSECLYPPRKCSVLYGTTIQFFKYGEFQTAQYCSCQIRKPFHLRDLHFVTIEPTQVCWRAKCVCTPALTPPFHVNIHKYMPRAFTCIHFVSCVDIFIPKQDRQCTYNAIFRRVRATVVVVRKQRVLNNQCVCVCVCVCVCRLTYPAYNAHVPYCHLWPAPL